MKYISFLFLFLFLAFDLNAQNDDWASYGKDPGGGHFSKATEITPDNVKNLERIWVHRSGDYHAGLNWTEDVIPVSYTHLTLPTTPYV